MKKFYFVLLALGLAACGQEQSQKADAAGILRGF